MQSMTGYGKSEYSDGKITVSVEVKTVNNRFLDIIPKYPRSFVAYDDLIRKTAQSKLARGRVELFVSLSSESEQESEVSINEGLAKKYVDIAKDLSKRYKLKNDFSVVSLMKTPDVLTLSESQTDEEKTKEILLVALNGAFDNLNEMRKVEGEKLKKDILSRNEKVFELVEKISKRAPMLKDEYHKKITERVKEILGDVNYDETRLLTETTIFADKSNIDEELTRLKSHIEQLKTICDSGFDEGKKLDFLMQEFNRETNTICSKSNDIEITKIGLELKNEIEKIREQVQNVE